MVDFRKRDSVREASELRLETPRLSGYRSGMSSTGLIGRRLARVYEVGNDVPCDINLVLDALDGKVGGTR